MTRFIAPLLTTSAGAVLGFAGAVFFASPALAQISFAEATHAQEAAASICPSAYRLTKTAKNYVAEVKFQADLMEIEPRERALVLSFCVSYLQGRVDALEHAVQVMRDAQ